MTYHGSRSQMPVGGPPESEIEYAARVTEF